MVIRAPGSLLTQSITCRIVLRSQELVMPTADPSVAALRRFNRLYTQKIGALDRDHLDSGLNLTEARVLFELAAAPGLRARTLQKDLGLDAGYISRLISRFEAQGLLERRASDGDRRGADLHLTAKGLTLFRHLSDAADHQIGGLLGALSSGQRRDLIRATATIRNLLTPSADDPLTLRPPGPGDLGWVVQSHGALYAEEYGWDERFEGLVAGVVADYVRTFDPARARGWIATLGDAPVGSVFVVDDGDDVARLRLLLVDPAARGRGLGERLIAECLSFARQAGYREMVLWTQSLLTGARRLYDRAGFTLERSEPHDALGRPLVGETWRLRL
jgi:DNA-binding MarR family transcriptional regulator/GNAT superfamily N-acetyltransferase